MHLAGWISGIETGRSWSLSESELQLLWIQGYIVHPPAIWELKWSKPIGWEQQEKNTTKKSEQSLLCDFKMNR